MNVDLKWSLWSQDLDVWREYDPKALDRIKRFIKDPDPDENVVICTAPVWPRRFGRVEMWADDEGVGVGVEFETGWDDAGDLVDTLNLPPDCVDELVEVLPRNSEYAPGVRIHDRKIFRKGARLGTIMKWIDGVEDRLLAKDAEEWEEMKKWAESMRREGE